MKKYFVAMMLAICIVGTVGAMDDIEGRGYEFGAQMLSVVSSVVKKHTEDVFEKTRERELACIRADRTCFKQKADDLIKERRDLITADQCVQDMANEVRKGLVPLVGDIAIEPSAQQVVLQGIASSMKLMLEHEISRKFVTMRESLTQKREAFLAADSDRGNDSGEDRTPSEKKFVARQADLAEQDEGCVQS